ESLLKQSMFGFRYIWEHRPLFDLQMVFFASNLIASLCLTIFPALVLARTGNNAAALGSTQSAAAVGGVAGGALLTAWGGPKRKVNGVLMGMVLTSLLGTLVVGLGRSLPVWMAGSFLMMVVMTIINGSNQAIWQSKVPPALQGRVFSVRRLVAQVTVPVAMLASGPLADKVFGPAMMPAGSLAPVFGWGREPRTGVWLADRYWSRDGDFADVRVVGPGRSFRRDRRLPGSQRQRRRAAHPGS
ncbi:MAG: hypothetical protein NTW63_02865, partial [Caldiserica bacterium]|nr:hypothetical protein [Caldisericota bacterium]